MALDGLINYDEFEGNVAVVPVSLMEKVVNDSKSLLEQKMANEMRLAVMESTVAVQKERIQQLENLCRDMYVPPDEGDASGGTKLNSAKPGQGRRKSTLRKTTLPSMRWPYSQP